MRRAIWFPLVVILILILILACGGEPEPGPGSCRPAETTCQGDACIGEPWSAGEFGDPCGSSQECASGICGQDTQTGDKFCTQTCAPGSADPCPQGATCLPTGDATANVCGPPVDC